MTAHRSCYGLAAVLMGLCLSACSAPQAASQRATGAGEPSASAGTAAGATPERPAEQVAPSDQAARSTDGPWTSPILTNFSDAAVSDTTRSLFQNAVRHGFGYYYFFRGYHLVSPEANLRCQAIDAKYGGALALLGAIAVSVPGAWQPDSEMDDYDERGAPGQEVSGALTLDEVVLRTRQIIRSLAACHTANGGRRFGSDENGINRGTYDAWQTAEKVATLGTAGWLMDGRLSQEERVLVASMVRRQLNDRLLQSVEYWNGQHGNGWLEEESGQAAFLSLASVMFPDDADIATRHENLVRHWLGSTARPSDRTSDALLHGKRVRDWVEGYNLRKDGAMVNHNRYFPQYQATVMWNLFSATHWAAAGRGIPQGALFNADFLYRAFVDVKFPAGRADPLGLTGNFIAPGGTMYQRGTWKVYAPNGIDAAGPAGYGHKDLSAFAALDGAVEKLGLDHRASIPAKTWLEQFHGRELLRMQLRQADRRCFAGEYGKDLRHPRDVTRAPGVFTEGDLEHQNGAREGQCIRNIARSYLIQAIDLAADWRPFTSEL